MMTKKGKKNLSMKLLCVCAVLYRSSFIQLHFFLLLSLIAHHPFLLFCVNMATAATAFAATSSIRFLLFKKDFITYAK